MLLPIRTSIRPNRTPYMNYALIAANVIIFALTYSGGEQTLRSWASGFMLTPGYPYLWQFVSYGFLHGGAGHIFGNMFFLYIFGNNVNDRLGHINYLCFYLAGAIFSAIGHIFAASLSGGLATPVLGASGAVAAVTGAYLVLFPQTLITIVYWFFFIGTMDLPAIYLILFKMIFLDNVIVRNVPNVAYDAHLAGYAFGVFSILLLLVSRILESDHFDLWQMLSRWNKRRRYRTVVQDDLYGQRISKKIKVKEVQNAPLEENDPAAAVRQEIITLISQGNLASAAQVYVEKAQQCGTLPRQTLLDISNQLMSAGNWTQAASAYEKFLSVYGSYPHTEQVQLMLGLIYARYLPDKQKAIECLKQSLNKLTDSGQRKMCQDEIARLEG